MLCSPYSKAAGWPVIGQTRQVSKRSAYDLAQASVQNNVLHRPGVTIVSLLGSLCCFMGIRVNSEQTQPHAKRTSRRFSNKDP